MGSAMSGTTEELFRQDSYIRECEATVLQVDGDDNGISVFAGNETRSNREQLNQNTVAASYLNAGNDVAVSAGNDLLVSGSDVNTGRNLDLSAVNNATINASQGISCSSDRQRPATSR